MARKKDYLHQNEYRKPQAAEPRDIAGELDAIRAKFPKWPPPVFHGRRCGDCRNWNLCKPVIGTVYTDSDYCHQSHVGPDFANG